VTPPSFVSHLSRTEKLDEPTNQNGAKEEVANLNRMWYNTQELTVYSRAITRSSWFSSAHLAFQDKDQGYEVETLEYPHHPGFTELYHL
jgi:hypothetical protein